MPQCSFRSISLSALKSHYCLLFRLSGVVIVQTVLYYKMYASDPTQIKALVRSCLAQCSAPTYWSLVTRSLQSGINIFDAFPRTTSELVIFRLLDSCHSGCIWAAIWNYLIDHYGNSARIDFIPWSANFNFYCLMYPDSLNFRFFRRDIAVCHESFI